MIDKDYDIKEDLEFYIKDKLKHMKALLVDLKMAGDDNFDELEEVEDFKNHVKIDINNFLSKASSKEAAKEIYEEIISLFGRPTSNNSEEVFFKMIRKDNPNKLSKSIYEESRQHKDKLSRYCRDNNLERGETMKNKNIEENATVSGDIATPDVKLGDKPQRRKTEPDEYLGGIPVFMVEMNDLLSSTKARRTGARYSIKNENVRNFLRETNYKKPFYISSNNNYFRVK